MNRKPAVERRETVIRHEMEYGEQFGPNRAENEIRSQLRRLRRERGMEVALQVARRHGVLEKYPRMMEGL